MRKITVLSMITLEGVMQAPGGPEEDTSGGFKYGGWTAPYFDKAYGKILETELKQTADYLLGRKTFEIWSSYWPEHADIWPGIKCHRNRSIVKQFFPVTKSQRVNFKPEFKH